MSKREISVVLKAKNSLSKGLKNATKSLKNFSGSVVNVGKKMAKGFLAGFAGITAGLAASAVKAQAFNKQMAQVGTLADINMKDAKKQVRTLSAEFGLAKDSLTKGLYDALSAGVPKENVFEFLRTSAQTAVAGATDTASAVDFLTTALNSFKIDSGSAGAVADALFATVKLGKTTVAELAASFAQVGPLASSSGVAFEEVMAAAATLTKQGTPTAQAMTQIRAAIIAMNGTLGDGWSKTMTLQQGMQAMADKAGGSQEALKGLVGRIEGVNAILGTTGQNAKMAASDLAGVAGGAGAMGEAFRIANESNPLDKMKEALGNIIIALGDSALEAFGPSIERGAAGMAKFAEKIAEWGGSAEMEAIKLSVEGIINAMLQGGPARSEALTAVGAFLKSAFLVGAEKAGAALMAIAPKIGKAIGATAKIGLGFGATAEDKAKARAEVGAGDLGKFDSTVSFRLQRKFNEELDKSYKLALARNQEERMFAELGVTSQKSIEGQSAAQTALNASIKALGNLSKYASEEIVSATQATTQSAGIAIKTQKQVGQVVKQTTQEVVESEGVKAEASATTSETVKEVNEVAAEKTKEAWVNAKEAFKEGEMEKVQAAQESADEIVKANNRASQAQIGGRSAGGSFETSGARAQAIQNLTRSGMIPNNGTVVNAAEMKGIQQRILAEMTRIRQTNEKNLQFG